MKILVTGGTGFIGSHTVVELQNAGFKVVVADNLVNSERSVIESIAEISGVAPEFEETDLSDPIQTEGLFQRHPDIKAVIHFAALKAVGDSVNRPLEYYRNNIFSLINIVKSMKDSGIDNFVFSSSCTVYGQANILPVTENTPRKDAESPYGNTKKIAEDILSNEVDASDFHCIALRYFNPIGAHPSAIIGELPLGVPDNLVPYITQTAIGIREQLKVFGDDYNTKDGTPIRDYIHVVDLADGHVKALGHMKDFNKVMTINLGTGKGYSVLDMVKAFEKVTEKKVPYKIVSRRAGDIGTCYADPAYAKEVLGWKATQSIEQMCEDSWRWQSNNPEGY
jgi:UDP-glucose 4-epimerase